MLLLTNQTGNQFKAVAFLYAAAFCNEKLYTFFYKKTFLKQMGLNWDKYPSAFQQGTYYKLKEGKEVCFMGYYGNVGNWNNNYCGGYNYGGDYYYGGGNGSTFTLIVVLFILLIIVGTAFL